LRHPLNPRDGNPPNLQSIAGYEHPIIKIFCVSIGDGLDGRDESCRAILN
jgi:hypothetical protein